MVFINRKNLKETAIFTLNQDVISTGSMHFIINRNWELIEIPIEIKKLHVEEIHHSFASGGNIALDGISFQLSHGQMMAIMGPSGSGKTTLLKVLLGEIRADKSKIMIDDLDFVANYSFFQRHIGYVPQDDLLFTNLSVYENLYYNLRLRLPQIRDKIEIKTRIENILRNVGLYDQRNLIVGDVMNKKLSGGQRRRLNIALELVSNPMIMILDEPTSGLSSKDSENITRFLAEIKEQGKIIICTIHQPNATIFSTFDRVLLMDKGGCQVFYGNTDEVFKYFDDELAQLGNSANELHTKKKQRMPEYFFDLIELTNELGSRVFPPGYWKQRYRDFRFREAMDLGQHTKPKKVPGSGRLISTVFHRSALSLLIKRTFVNKLRNRMNIFMTLCVAPILALLTAFVLRSTPEGIAYSFSRNQNLPLFGFVSIIIFIFIGLANSVDDILSEKRIIQREKKLNISVLANLGSKDAVLFLVTFLQASLYHYIASLVLDMRGFALPSIVFLSLSGIIGYKFGLLASSLINDRAALINILPLVIIPQIMFGGAVIKYADMNKNLRIFKKSEIPEFCQIIPSRWLYEGMVLAQDKYGYYNFRKQRFIHTIRDPKLTFEGYKKNLESYNHFLENYPEERYTNDVTTLMVRTANGRYLNQERNIFLSPKIMTFGKERSTLFLDFVASILIAFVLSLLTWIKLKFFYK